MIDVTDAQVAPISPISRLRPTSAGLVTVATCSDAMVEPSFGSVCWAALPVGVGLIVLIGPRPEKNPLGIILVTAGPAGCHERLSGSDVPELSMKKASISR